MWRLLQENFHAARFRRQVPLRNFIVDFASHQARLVIEVDGGQHGGARDEARTTLIEAEGYGLVRFWNNDVIGNRGGVAASIAAALRPIHPHPSLPHHGGGCSEEN